MKKRVHPEEKSSLTLYVIFLSTGILVTGLCLDKFIIYYHTNEISLQMHTLFIQGFEALFSIIIFFVSGLLFIVYAILEYAKLLHKRMLLRVIASVLLFLIVCLSFYYAHTYFIHIQDTYMWQ